MTGARAPAGGQKKFARLGAEDFVCKLAGPMVEQAFTEFPAAVMALRGRLPLDEGPIGLLGG
ncbi:MAG TPA: alpha/beta hydrolase, partial [Streptosporangiaceae bacterium]|nr:alpha/beta hydrolase [Streptosporangiaceae bacterium]